MRHAPWPTVYLLRSATWLRIVIRRQLQFAHCNARQRDLVARGLTRSRATCERVFTNVPDEHDWACQIVPDRAGNARWASGGGNRERVECRTQKHGASRTMLGLPDAMLEVILLRRRCLAHTPNISRLRRSARRGALETTWRDDAQAERAVGMGEPQNPILLLREWEEHQDACGSRESLIYFL